MMQVLQNVGCEKVEGGKWLVIEIFSFLERTTYSVPLAPQALLQAGQVNFYLL